MQLDNVDPGEIAKFSSMAKEWWNPFGSCGPLHEINPLRLDFIKNKTILENKIVLDVGCGGGILSEGLAKMGADVVGIDLSEEAIFVAQKHVQQQNLRINYFVSSAEEYAALKPESFDIITCMELLEHVPNPASIIQACARLLKPNGQIFFSTINRNIKSFLYAIVGAEYILKLLPTGTHEYEKFIKPSELSDMMRAVNLHLAGIKGIHYNPFLKNYQLSPDVSVNYLAYAINCKSTLKVA